MEQQFEPVTILRKGMMYAIMLSGILKGKYIQDKFPVHMTSIRRKLPSPGRVDTVLPTRTNLTTDAYAHSVVSLITFLTVFYSGKYNCFSSGCGKILLYTG
jgi:hypothetical protein